MRRVSLAEKPCPIARTLDVVGEWWKLLPPLTIPEEALCAGLDLLAESLHEVLARPAGMARTHA